MNEMIKNLGDRMVTLVRVINMYSKEHHESENRMETRKSNKFDHEFKGMVMAIEAMGFAYDLEWDNEVVEIKTIIIQGISFEV